MQSGSDSQALARELEGAWRSRRTIEPFSERGLISTVEQAYAVQRAWAEMRAAGGETTVGRKIGLTSEGMQKQMGVDEPDFGDLWASRQYFAEVDGVAEIPVNEFLQPRVEGEIAFLMGSDLPGGNVDEDDVMAAAEAAAVSLEIVDSRIADWRIKLVDTIADNASYGGFVLGDWSQELLALNLRETVLTVEHNGSEVVREPGTAVLGSPLSAVAWLANRLASLGVEIKQGDIILSGSFGAAVPAVAGDRFRASIEGIGSVEMQF